MASRKPPQQPVHASLNAAQMQKGISRLEKIISEIDAFDVNAISKRWGSEQKALETHIEGALSSIFGHDTVEYRRYADATSLDNGPVQMVWGDGIPEQRHDVQLYISEGKENAVLILKSAIKWLRDELGDENDIGEAKSAVAPSITSSQKIFIVHGHDDAARQAVARFIERIGFEAVILSEQANQGKTIIEKIEANRDVGFAVVLLTPDDVGGKSVDALRPRARQNVLLELGYFMARLGRERVCALAKGDIEIPTDFAGVVWTPLDEHDAWMQKFARELKAAGYAIDWNKVMA
ncbi:TIR domain-containing protein [Massilia sp. YIM B04103]|uniref:TIR domain-containing protein n=1 Tax=Massilia sp. YIM B04103 TaxID=2963106 RepID=UPI00210E7291|nr:nucleotide-binding protein [Massilia sp. YIM B04103]